MKKYENLILSALEKARETKNNKYLSKVCNWNHYKPEILRFIYKLCQNVNETQH
jgi:hypothetical protein